VTVCCVLVVLADHHCRQVPGSTERLCTAVAGAHAHCWPPEGREEAGGGTQQVSERLLITAAAAGMVREDGHTHTMLCCAVTVAALWGACSKTLAGWTDVVCCSNMTESALACCACCVCAELGWGCMCLGVRACLPTALSCSQPSADSWHGRHR
jgi:hypothetical protein